MKRRAFHDTVSLFWNHPTHTLVLFYAREHHPVGFTFTEFLKSFRWTTKREAQDTLHTVFAVGVLRRSGASYKLSELGECVVTELEDMKTFLEKGEPRVN